MFTSNNDTYLMKLSSRLCLLDNHRLIHVQTYWHSCQWIITRNATSICAHVFWFKFTYLIYIFWVYRFKVQIWLHKKRNDFWTFQIIRFSSSCVSSELVLSATQMQWLCGFILRICGHALMFKRDSLQWSSVRVSIIFIYCLIYH